MKVLCIRKYLAISVSLSIKYPCILVIHIYSIICLLHVVNSVHIISECSILISYLHQHFSVSLTLDKNTTFSMLSTASQLHPK